jgi:DNA-directed RNA polymerase omega subunit
MNVKTLSRGPSIDIDKCVDMSGGNRFDLVIMATVRAREIRRNFRTSNKQEHLHPVVTSLLEFQEGKIGREYLKRVR